MLGKNLVMILCHLTRAQDARNVTYTLFQVLSDGLGVLYHEVDSKLVQFLRIAPQAG